MRTLLCVLLLAGCDPSSTDTGDDPGPGGGEGGGGGGDGGGDEGGIGDDSPIEGNPLHVDGACAVSGDGTAEACAGAAGQPGAFRDPQECLDIAVAGDTCLVKDGTYITARDGSDPSEDGGFTFARSGTVGAPITLRSHPGHRPLLANCDPTATSFAECDHPTITLPERSHIRISGLRIRGAVNAFHSGESEADLGEGLVIARNEITAGWAEPDDGNWTGIFVGLHRGAHLHHNFVHDIALLDGALQQSSASCIKLYTAIDSVVEYNTCADVAVAESQAGGIDDKQDSVRNTHRYNLIERVNGCVRLQNQSFLFDDVVDTRVYQNVCIATADVAAARDCFRLEAAGSQSLELFHNTCVGFTNGVQVLEQNEGETVAGVRVYNNVFASSAEANLIWYPAGDAPVVQDYNAYQQQAYFQLDGQSYGSLTDLRAGTPFDDGSIAPAGFGFVSATDHHLAADSACAGAGREGGQASGAAVDLGAYVAGIDCVGHTCP